MRPALRSFLPASTDQRRQRALAVLTAVVAAAGIAAATATSADDDDAAPVPSAAGDPAHRAGSFPLPAGDPASRGERSPVVDTSIGAVERLSEQEELPSLTPPDPSVTARDVAADPAAPADGNGPEGDTEPVYETADGDRIDAARVSAFLDGRGAPLAAHAETIVAAGVAHDVDPRVVVAIAIAESNGGELLPAGSHNAWGWGGSGPRGLRAWESWEVSIDEYTERLGALYDTDDVDWDFASTYCPPNTQWWYDTVTWAIDQI